MQHNPTDLVHIVDWPTYLHYVREDKIKNTRQWRPPQLTLFVSELDHRAEELSESELGSFVRLLLAYVSSPLIDPSGSALGPRRLTFASASRALRIRGEHKSRTWDRLEQMRLVAVVPSQDENGVVEWSPVESIAVESSQVESIAVESSSSIDNSAICYACVQADPEGRLIDGLCGACYVDKYCGS